MKVEKNRLLLAISTVIIICSLSLSLILYIRGVYNTTLLFDASKQQSNIVQITLPNRIYNDDVFYFSLECGRNYYRAATEMDKYTYPPDFMVFIRNRLKDNLIIESMTAKQIPFEIAQDGEPGLSTNEIAHVYVTPHPEQKTIYTFRLKNPGSLRRISCDISVIQPKI